MLIFDLVTLNTQRLRARRAANCQAHGRAGQAPAPTQPTPTISRSEFDSLSLALDRGFTLIDVRDARERDAEPLPGESLHLPMARLLTDATGLQTRTLLSTGLRHRQAQRGGRRPVALAGLPPLPLAARRHQGAQSFRLRLAHALLAVCLMGPGASAADRAYGEHPLLDLARRNWRRRANGPRRSDYGAPEREAGRTRAAPGQRTSR